MLDTVTNPTPVPSPPWFKPIRGEVHSPHISRAHVPITGRAATTAKENGLRYERQVHDFLVHFCVQHDCAVMRSPVIDFWDDFGEAQEFRRCIPDALIRFPHHIVIAEIKISHMPEAWWQLEKLYRPVVTALLPKCNVYTLEIVRSFDPSVPYPAPIELVDDLAAWLLAPTPTQGVFVWRK